MSDPERPPLDPRVFEQILLVQHKVDIQHWPLIAALQSPLLTEPSIPVRPPTPLQLIASVQWYAEMLFKAEADQYESFRENPRYPAWLSRLADRILVRALESVKQIDNGLNFKTLWVHGVGPSEMQESIRASLNTLVTRYAWDGIGPTAQVSVEPAPQEEAKGVTALPEVVIPSQAPKQKRRSSQIYSPSAAQKVQAYMDRKVLDQTAFAIQANTTDKTIRKLLKTGMAKRSILISIAAAMGLSKEDLLS